MGSLVALNIVVPWVIALIIFLAKKDVVTNWLTILTLPLLLFFAYLVFKSPMPALVHTPHWIGVAITLYDYGLLGYFMYLGIKNRHVTVIALALLQILLLSIVLIMIKEDATANIYVDNLTALMFLIVAIVGVPIAIFATKYMEFDEKGKHSFVAIVIWFLGVMNFAVSVNNIEWFFALFETTTLASVVMIGFRKDEEAINNSMLALWMNQIGGVAILLGLMALIKNVGIYHFTDLLNYAGAKTLILAGLGFLSISALVKGAQMPFHKWL
ncbi:proton-conducting transporter transmembrane domain-containing protein, partial [Caminibacter sp.]